MAHNHDKLVRLLGGQTALGKVLGATPQAVDRWRKCGVPIKHWPKIAKICKERKIRIPVEIRDFLA